MDWELEQARREFANSGLTPSQLLSQKGWMAVGEINGERMWCPKNKDLRAAMTEQQAVDQILRRWYED